MTTFLEHAVTFTPRDKSKTKQTRTHTLGEETSLLLLLEFLLLLFKMMNLMEWLYLSTSYQITAVLD